MANIYNVIDGLGRSIEVKELDMVDQFDLLEAAQNQAGYSYWFGMAALVFSCIAIDGVPLPTPRKPEDFKKNAKFLKDEGIAAVTKYFSEQGQKRDDDIVEDSVKN